MLSKRITVLSVAGLTSLFIAQTFGSPIWTETFDADVGRFNITTGHADTVFVHDAADGNLDATFIRRELGVPGNLDRRLADLGETFTERDIAAFSLEWTPISYSGGSPWPSIGFYDSSSSSHIAGIKIDVLPGPNWRALLPGLGDNQGPEGPGYDWAFGQTYKLEFEINGPAHSASLAISILNDGVFDPLISSSWQFPEEATYSFYALGVGNITDQSFGATFVAEIDSFSLAKLTCTDGDVNGDATVDFTDLNFVLSGWGRSDGGIGFIPEADLDGSGLVDFNDLNEVLSNWDTNCETP